LPPRYIPLQIASSENSPRLYDYYMAAGGPPDSRKVYVCVFQFRCSKCWSTNLIRRILRAASEDEAKSRIHDGSASCKFCGLLLAADAEFASDLHEAAPDEIEFSEVEPDSPTTP
jgi:hypothetical protein